MAGPNTFTSRQLSSPRASPGEPAVDGAPSGVVLDAGRALSPHPPLHLPAGHRAFIEHLARDAYPHEACGLLLGTHDVDAVRVARVSLARNLATERLADRYILDPQDYLLADEHARRDNIDIVGIWHTHPDHPARPSQTDLGKAWADYSYIIVAVHLRKVVDVTTWRLDGNNFIQQILKETS